MKSNNNEGTSNEGSNQDLSNGATKMKIASYGSYSDIVTKLAGHGNVASCEGGLIPKVLISSHPANNLHRQGLCQPWNPRFPLSPASTLRQIRH